MRGWPCRSPAITVSPECLYIPNTRTSKGISTPHTFLPPPSTVYTDIESLSRRRMITITYPASALSHHFTCKVWLIPRRKVSFLQPLSLLFFLPYDD